MFRTMNSIRSTNKLLNSRRFASSSSLWPMKVAMSVRGTELDSFAHVNNAVFLNYLEHARWEMIKQVSNITGKQSLAAFGDSVLPVIRRVEIDYLHELKLGDSFDVTLNPTKVSNSTFVISGDITITDSKNPKAIGKLASTSQAVIVCVDRKTGKKAILKDDIKELFAPPE
mmetsp:Transcript_12517/g.21116  ORF Transcript_12517/g.21116 Transcript_12517/m.21116 type:complete len:171 (+) Transcript_12517:2733-3245(+)